MRYLLISITGLLITLGSCKPRAETTPDFLEKVASETQLITDLKDIYRSYSAYHTLEDKAELIQMYVWLLNAPNRNEDEDSLRSAFEASMKQNTDSLLADIIRFRKLELSSDSVRFHLREFLLQYELFGKSLQEHSYDLKFFRTGDSLGTVAGRRFTSFLTSHYPQEKFVNLTDEMYYQKVDKKSKFTSDSFDLARKIASKDLMQGLDILEALSRSARNPDQYAICQIEIADQMVNNEAMILKEMMSNPTPTPKHIAVQKYGNLLDKGIYSLYLYETWLKWRTVKQADEYGLHPMSKIPNAEYEKVREQAALTVLRYIAKHPDDIMAINQFLVIATHGIVNRFSEMDGLNQAGVDFSEIFYNVAEPREK